jgi:hypothetical protein
MKLAELEAAFQEAILGEPGKILGSICDSSRLSRADRFAVYADAYRLRLAEFVGNDYPTLRSALGDEEFGALVAAYIDANASLHRNARWYARRLPDFMAADDVWRDKRSWVDLAYFERALADAFDAKDATPVTIDALAAVAAEDQPRMRFEFQPSLTPLKLAQGTIALYEVAVEGDSLPEPSDGQETVLVWRDQEQDAVYRRIEDDEALALDAAGAGASFGEICGLLGLSDTDDTVAARAAGFLARWFADGLVTSLSWH